MLYEGGNHPSVDILQKRLKIEGIITQNDVLREVDNPAWLNVFDTIYTSEQPEFNVVPYPIFSWGRDLMRRYVNHIEPGSNEEEGVVRKTIYHIPEVTRTGIAIAKNSVELGVDINQAATSVYLHDVARAAQWYHFLTFNDKRSFDHAQVGAAMIERAHLPFKAVHLDQARIVDAVADHSRRCVKNPSIYSQLTRDADKIVIFKERLAILKNKWLHGGIPTSYISSDVLDQFRSGSLVLNDSIETPADHIVQSISWMFDINLPASREMIIKEGIFEKLLDNLSRICEVPDDIPVAVERF